MKFLTIFNEKKLGIDIIILLTIIVLAMASFIFEWLPVDHISVLIMVSLVLTGLVTTVEGVSGFSNEATLTVLFLMILSIGMETTGVVHLMGQHLGKLLQGSEVKSTFVIMLSAAVMSAFIPTTAVVIVFMRILLKLAPIIKVPISKLLIPLSFGGILGGSSTLIGTSTNILVGAFAKTSGLKPFGIFEFTPIGVVVFIAALIYMLLIGRKLLPSHTAKNSDEDFSSPSKFMTEIYLDSSSSLIGVHPQKTNFFKNLGLQLVDIRKGPNQYFLPELIDRFETGDVLLLEGSYENITSLLKIPGIMVMSRGALESKFPQEKTILCELYVKANSRLLQQKIDKSLIKTTYGFDVIAIKKGSHYVNAKNKWRIIHSGDTLLASVPAPQITRISNLNEFVLLQELEEFTQPSRMRYLAGSIFLFVILLSATNILPLMVSAMLGCVVMFLTGCLSLQRSYRRIDWSIFFLLAGMIPLGAAIVNTGLDVMVATSFLTIFSDLNPVFILAGLFIITAGITSIMSNNATAILLSPIALSIANQMGMDPRPFLVIVMYGASTCYFTPIGYQTNMLIYSPGNYTFKDFMKVGGLLTVIVCICITVLVYWFYLMP